MILTNCRTVGHLNKVVKQCEWCTHFFHGVKRLGKYIWNKCQLSAIEGTVLAQIFTSVNR